MSSAMVVRQAPNVSSAGARRPARRMTHRRGVADSSAGIRGTGTDQPVR